MTTNVPAPDFYLGDDEGQPPHWGGPVRRCWKLKHLRTSWGRRALLVRVEPPLPDLGGGAPWHEVVLGERSASDDLDALGSRSIQVNIGVPKESAAPLHDPVEADELIVAWCGFVAREPRQLDPPPPPAERWQRDLARIARYIEEYGDADVPLEYHDEVGPLGALVAALRSHRHAGSTGDGGPYPGVAWVTDLDGLAHWHW